MKPKATEPLHQLALIQEASFARAAASTASSFPAERRMDGAQLEAFLRRKRYAVLATTRPDGTPHAAPIGYALVGARFVIASLPDAARVRNLRAQPHASLVVTEGDQHAVVVVDGTARLLPAMEAPLELRAPFRDPDGSLPAWVGVIVTVTPERLLSYAAPGWSP